MSESINLADELAGTIARVAAMPPAQKAKAAHEMWAQLLKLQGQVANLRTSAVRQLRSEGQTLRRIAADLDVSVTRVRQIEDYAPAPAASKEAIAGK